MYGKVVLDMLVVQQQHCCCSMHVCAYLCVLCNIAINTCSSSLPQWRWWCNSGVSGGQKVKVCKHSKGGVELCTCLCLSVYMVNVNEMRRDNDTTWSLHIVVWLLLLFPSSSCVVILYCEGVWDIWACVSVVCL
eukprot:GHVS01090559.1.p1 GENE.GHVS01090559.1~~GHVS01090559.1.p1  ORF type:complete len:134 (-),score=34.32 GHVS01090559.1:298-699(-)